MKKVVAAAALLSALVGGQAGPSAIEVVARAADAQDASDDLLIRRLLTNIEAAARQADVSRYLELLTPSADQERATLFAQSEFRTGADRVVIQERDRQHLAGTLPGNGYTLVVDAFTEQRRRGRVATWQLEVRLAAGEWRVAAQSRIAAVDNLHRLLLNPLKQFEARQFTVAAEDLQLTLVEGSVFVVETDEGITGLVLMGRGDMRFAPAPESEKSQVRIFAGTETVASRFDAAFVRVGSFDAHADRSTLQPRDVDPRELKRAEGIFREESAKSFTVDLADLTRDAWSLLPGPRDFLAEIRTRRFGTLTYSRSALEAEDISFFERRRRRNIAAYASTERLATRGRFYNEDDLAPFDVLEYDIAVSATPDRLWVEGKTSMRLEVRALSLSQLTIRLADSLVVRSVVSAEYGRLFSLRVTGQDTILVNLPATLLQGSQLNVMFEYGGYLRPQPSDREAVALAQRGADGGASMEEYFARPDASYLYSNRSYWYPQSMVTDYATATIQIAVPGNYTCAATGEQTPDSPQLVPGRESSDARKVYLFTAARPLRYLAFLVARLARADQWTVAFTTRPPDTSSTPSTLSPPSTSSTLHLSNPSNPSYPSYPSNPYTKLNLIVESTPRLTGRGRSIAERAADIVQFYESLVGDAPYAAFTVALLESELPGGHSPGYFAVVNEAVPHERISWRDDPAAFPSYPEFFLAHEIAHQWWGQAVGWRNYHEQWLSEGFAQYFAALYAQKFRGAEVFDAVIRHMRRWAIGESDQGAVYLGYRIGHIKNDSRAFRAVVYNKGAAVLHMLRRLVGDDVFFRGIRHFYAASRFTKAGTDDLRVAMEAEWGQPLERFFERWIYNAELPRVAFSYRIEGTQGSMGTVGSKGTQGSVGSVVLRFEQTGDIFDVPVTATLRYADGTSTDVFVPITDQLKELRVPLEGQLRSIDISKDDGSLVEMKVR